MTDHTIATANDVYAFVAQLKTEADKCGNTYFARELDDALHLGSSGLEILGAIRKISVKGITRSMRFWVQVDGRRQRTLLPL